MRTPRRAVLVLCLSLLASGGLASCGAETGGSCSVDGDCPGALCLKAAEGFPGGLCSASCETAACGSGLGCRQAAGRAVCLPRCGAASSCRDGYQCVKGLCQPPCRADAECGLSSLCRAGACVPRPGAADGAACDVDGDCSSGACAESICAQRCERDGDCGDAQTCVLDRGARELRGLCIDLRGGAAPVEACSSDTNCDRGTCLMGACLQLCQTPQDCAGEAQTRSCTGLPAPLKALPQAEWPEMRVCLPRNQTFSASVKPPLLVPRTARSVLLMTYALNFDESAFAGLGSLQDPDGDQLYRLPTSQMIYTTNVIRSSPDAGGSSLLLSSSPTRAPLRYGVYGYTSVAQTQAGASVRHDVRAYYQLYDAPLTAGRVPLRVHVTDLAGLPSACPYRNMDAARAEKLLAPMITRLKQVYQQANVGLTLDPITFVDSDAPNSITATDQSTLHATLRAASMDTAGGLDLVIVRAISPSAVLGIAGGIPAAPGVAGSPHTGAAVSAYALCYSQLIRDQQAFALIVGHELGHTMGLSHNREQDGTSDPLGDGTAASESYTQEQDNLMFWNADGYGSSLTGEQGIVMRGMPQVRR